MYCKYRNTLNKIISIARKNYFKEKIEQAEGNKRKIWNTINEITNYSQKTNEIKKKIDIDGFPLDVESDSTRVTNYFNNYFSQVGSSVVDSVCSGHINPVPDTDTCQSYLYFNNIEPKEIEEIITGLKREERHQATMELGSTP